MSRLAVADAAVEHRLIAAVVERNIAGDYGATSPAALLVQLLRICPAEAKARVARARDLGPRRVPSSGELLDPILPTIAAAQRAGDISTEHASVIVKAVEAIPDRLAAQFTELVETTLVDVARHHHPGQVARAGWALLARIDHDGIEPREEEHQRRCGFTLRKNRDRSGTPMGRWTPELCAVIDAVLDALSAPQPTTLDDGTVVPDPRTAAQRRHDALLEAGLRLLRSGTLPESGGAPATVLAHLSADQLPDHLAGQTGYTTTGHGDLLPIATLLRLASEANVIPVVFDAAGGILSYGQQRRLASCGQRHALAARDQGCTFPGCTRPPAWCEAHHVIPWYVGGPTALNNLCLLCAYHHRAFERLGWQSTSSTASRNGPHPPGSTQTENPCATPPTTSPDITFNYPDTG